MTAPKMWHTPVGGNPDDAVRFGLTLIAKCGLIWVPTVTAGQAKGLNLPDCPECKAPGPHRLPGAPHFVYRCYDESDRLIYVGVSVAPKQRMDQHRQSSWWFGQTERIRYAVFPNKAYAQAMETKAIAEENPRWNVRGRDRTLWTIDDYRDMHHAMQVRGSAESRMVKLRDEALRLHNLDLAAEAVQA